MVKKSSKKVVRNGKVYVSAWIDKEVATKATDVAKKEKRTFSAYMELALAYHNASK